jgi:Mg2+/citrate symporter
MKYSALRVLEQPRIPDSELEKCIGATSVAPWQATSVLRDMALDLQDTREALRERLKWINIILALSVIAAGLALLLIILRPQCVPGGVS